MDNKKYVSKFEEFFTEEYKEDIFKLLEQYPKERGLIIDYSKLKQFDADLAELVFEKPEIIIRTAQRAIINIDPFVKEANINIRFTNFANGSGDDNVNSLYIGKFISIDCIVDNVEDVRPVIRTGVFECRGCLRLHEVEQKDIDKIIEPSLCSECGNRSFRLLLDDSKYVDSQVLTVRFRESSQKLKLILMDDLCSYDDFYNGLGMTVVGILKSIKDNKGVFNKYLLVNSFELIEDDDLISEELYVDVDNDESRRGSPEYNKWVKKVISNSNNSCQCCGGDKHLVAHHIFSYNNHHDYRLNPDNGVALCKWCHGKYHSYYGKDANPRTLIEFLNRFGYSKKIMFSPESVDDFPKNVSVVKEDDDIPKVDEIDSFKLDGVKMNFKPLLNLILNQCKSYDKGCSIDSLKERCLSKGISEEYIDLAIKTMINRGVIYQPCEGYLKIIR